MLSRIDANETVMLSPIIDHLVAAQDLQQHNRKRLGVPAE
jgi:hypothetical protein